MTTADQYRINAAEFFERAKYTPSAALQTEYATRATGYLRLAEQADRNFMTDVVYETRLVEE
jgi:hypothetical protein